MNTNQIKGYRGRLKMFLRTQTNGADVAVDLKTLERLIETLWGGTPGVSAWVGNGPSVSPTQNGRQV